VVEWSSVRNRCRARPQEVETGSNRRVSRIHRRSFPNRRRVPERRRRVQRRAWEGSTRCAGYAGPLELGVERSHFDVESGIVERVGDGVSDVGIVTPHAPSVEPPGSRMRKLVTRACSSGRQSKVNENADSVIRW